MTKFEVLKGITDVGKFSELIFDILSDKKTSGEIESFLAGEMSEEGLRGVKALALNGYPLSLERMQ